MSIDSIDDVVRTLERLECDEFLVDYIEEYVEGDGSSVINVNYIEDSDLFEEVTEIELSASHFFLDANGQINKNANDKLKKHGYRVERLSVPHNDVSYAICAKDFKIYFSNY
jgi:hypothetical protein